MAIPTITSITPAVGHSGGSTHVEIIGTNFRLPPDPAATGFVGGDFLRTVRVSIGGAIAKDVRVISGTRLMCVTRPHDPGAPVDVVVTNLDDDDDPIPTEEVTLAAGFTYTRPRLDDDAPSDLTRLCVLLIDEFKRQTIENVAITTDTDFDPETGDATNYVGVADLPAVILIGPNLSENRFYSTNELPESTKDMPSGEFATRREPRVCDVGFEVMLVTDATKQAINLVAAVESMFQRLKVIEIARSADAPDELFEFEIDIPFGGHFRSTGGRNNSDIRSFTGSFVVRGFPIDGLGDFPDDLLVRVDAEVIEPLIEGPEQIGE